VALGETKAVYIANLAHNSPRGFLQSVMEFNREPHRSERRREMESGIIVGLILGGMLFSWLFDLHQPGEVMAHQAGDVRRGKGCAGLLLIILTVLALLLIEVLPATEIGGIPTK